MRKLLCLLLNLSLLYCFTGCRMHSFDKEDFQKVNQISRDLVYEERIPLNEFEQKFIKQKDLNFSLRRNTPGKIWWHFNDKTNRALYFDITPGIYFDSVTWRSINYVIYNELENDSDFPERFDQGKEKNKARIKMMADIVREKLTTEKVPMTKKELTKVMKQPVQRGKQDEFTIITWNLEHNRFLIALVKKDKSLKSKNKYRCVQLKYKVKIFCKYED